MEYDYFDACENEINDPCKITKLSTFKIRNKKDVVWESPKSGNNDSLLLTGGRSSHETGVERDLETLKESKESFFFDQMREANKLRCSGNNSSPSLVFNNNAGSGLLYHDEKAEMEHLMYYVCLNTHLTLQMTTLLPLHDDPMKYGARALIEKTLEIHKSQNDVSGIPACVNKECKIISFNKGDRFQDTFSGSVYAAVGNSYVCRTHLVRHHCDGDKPCYYSRKSQAQEGHVCGFSGRVLEGVISASWHSNKEDENGTGNTERDMAAIEEDEESGEAYGYEEGDVFESLDNDLSYWESKEGNRASLKGKNGKKSKGKDKSNKRSKNLKKMYSKKGNEYHEEDPFSNDTKRGKKRKNTLSYDVRRWIAKKNARMDHYEREAIYFSFSKSYNNGTEVPKVVSDPRRRKYSEEKEIEKQRKLKQLIHKKTKTQETEKPLPYITSTTAVATTSALDATTTQTTSDSLSSTILNSVAPPLESNDDHNSTLISNANNNATVEENEYMEMMNEIGIQEEYETFFGCKWNLNAARLATDEPGFCLSGVMKPQNNLRPPGMGDGVWTVEFHKRYQYTVDICKGLIDRDVRLGYVHFLLASFESEGVASGIKKYIRELNPSLSLTKDKISKDLPDLAKDADKILNIATVFRSLSKPTPFPPASPSSLKTDPHNGVSFLDRVVCSIMMQWDVLQCSKKFRDEVTLKGCKTNQQLNSKDYSFTASKGMFVACIIALCYKLSEGYTIDLQHNPVTDAISILPPSGLEKGFVKLPLVIVPKMEGFTIPPLDMFIKKLFNNTRPSVTPYHPPAVFVKPNKGQQETIPSAVVLNTDTKARKKKSVHSTVKNKKTSVTYDVHNGKLGSSTVIPQVGKMLRFRNGEVFEGVSVPQGIKDVQRAYVSLVQEAKTLSNLKKTLLPLAQFVTQ